MITGAQLYEVLIFEKAISLRDFLKTSERFIASDSKLNETRLYEIAMRTTPATVADSAFQKHLSRAESLLRQRTERLKGLHESIRTMDQEIRSASDTIPDCRAAVIEATIAMKDAEARHQRDIRRSIDILDCKQEQHEIKQHLTTIMSWKEKGTAAAEGIMSDYDANPFFRYLKKKDVQSPSKFTSPIRSLDLWLAKQIDFSASIEHYNECRDYAETCDRWISSMREKHRMVEEKIADLTKILSKKIAPARQAKLEADNQAMAAEGLILQHTADLYRISKDLSKVINYEDQEGAEFVRLIAELNRQSIRHSSEAHGAGQCVNDFQFDRISMAAETDLLRHKSANLCERFSSIVDMISKMELQGLNTEASVFDLPQGCDYLHELMPGTEDPSRLLETLQAAPRAA